jgi:hypothetical protein
MNTYSTARMIDSWEKVTPVVVDVNELHTLEYKTSLVIVEEEKNLA